jgi:predicted GNAT family N-acyltransferase
MKMVEVISFQTSDKEKFEQARKIRESVFIIEQQVEERDEFDEFESSSIHYLLLKDKQVIGTARWRAIGNKVKLERFAVLKEFRGKRYGEALLKKVIKDASQLGRTLYLHAQLKAIPFYARQGFMKEGELFLECDIEHYKMTKVTS